MDGGFLEQERRLELVVTAARAYSAARMHQLIEERVHFGNGNGCGRAAVAGCSAGGAADSTPVAARMRGHVHLGHHRSMKSCPSIRQFHYYVPAGRVSCHAKLPLRECAAVQASAVLWWCGAAEEGAEWSRRGPHWGSACR